MTSSPENTNERLQSVRQRMAQAAQRFDDTPHKVELVAVSKTFAEDVITPLLEAGQRVFGENRVQEAQGKWPDLKQQYAGVNLHLIGPLQTNKVKEAVKLFDVIESVDRDKLAKSLGAEMVKQGKVLSFFVQVNIGGESQKAGCPIDDAVDFVGRCRDDYGRDIVGGMCVPPGDEARGPYFAVLAQLG